LDGSHYGAGDEQIKGGEEWSHIYGPWLFYINQGASDDAIWQDANRQWKAEIQQWPYSFVDEPSFYAAQRGTVKGSLFFKDITDPRDPTPPVPENTTVVLVEPVSVNGPIYQQSKNYFYWTKTDSIGNFVIPNVYAGTYEVHAWKDGYIGEYISNFTLTVKPQATVNLGKIEYQTPRFAPTLFEIGYPNRRADEYYHGDNFRQWGLYDLFPTDFPNSIHYYINSTWRQPPSQWRNEWNYAHVPVDNKSVNWTVYFDVPTQNSFGPKAYVFIAKAGACHCNLEITVNNLFLGIMTFKDNDNSVYRDSIYGVNELHSMSFAANILKAKGNQLIFGTTCKQRLQGIMYDYVRMELDNFKPIILEPLKGLQKK